MDRLLSVLKVLDHFSVLVVKFLLRFVAEELLITVVNEGNSWVHIGLFCGGDVLAIIEVLITYECRVLLYFGITHLRCTDTPTQIYSVFRGAYRFTVVVTTQLSLIRSIVSHAETFV